MSHNKIMQTLIEENLQRCYLVERQQPTEGERRARTDSVEMTSSHAGKHNQHTDPATDCHDQDFI